jgi:general secretion pathway protein G
MKLMKSKNSRRRRRGGFTLMEVLLVLAILVILGSLVGYYFVGMQKRGYSDAAKAQIGMFQQQLDLYHLDIGTYPSTAQGLAALRNPPADLANPAKWRHPYSEKDIPADPWGNPYQYELLSADQYRIWSVGADGQEGTTDDITSG